MSGLEFVQRVQRLGFNLPFVILRGKGGEETAAFAIKLGVYDYIMKRRDPMARVVSSIERAVGLHETIAGMRKVIDTLHGRDVPICGRCKRLSIGGDPNDVSSWVEVEEFFQREIKITVRETRTAYRIENPDISQCSSTV